MAASTRVLTAITVKLSFFRRSPEYPPLYPPSIAATVLLPALPFYTIEATDSGATLTLLFCRSL